MNLIIAAAFAIAAQTLDVVVIDVEGLTPDVSTFTAESYTKVGLDELSQLTDSQLLVLPQPKRFPAIAIPDVQAFLDRGGHLVAIGGPPFDELVFRRSDGEWVDLDGLLAEVEPVHDLVGWATVNTTPPRHNSGSSGGTSAYTPLPNGYVAELTIPEAASWMVREIPVHEPAPTGHDTLRFRISGEAPVETFMIEMREKDGARWMATTMLTSQPREVGIHRTAFRFWQDGSPPGRGSGGDAPDFANLVALQFGFAASHQPLHAGRYSYRIEGVATGLCGSEVVLASPLRLEGFSPSYKLFTTTAARSEVVGPLALDEAIVPHTILSPIARPMHDGPARDYVWQPHVKALDAEGRWVATPVSTTWHTSGATWSLVGWEPSADELKAILDGLASVIANGKPAIPPPTLLDENPTGATVSVSSGRFMLDGSPWFANGINFWPRYVAGMEPPEYYSHWLNPSDYVPELVDQDLAILQTLGVNVVSIQFERKDEVPQLRDFLARCGRYGIKANIFLRGAHPLDPDATDDLSQRPFLDLMRAADLRGNPHVFAYDLAWEPRMGVESERKRFDPLFVGWIEEQYGSVARAEEVWGTLANRVDGVLTGPTDSQLREDGPHRVMVAAYRRFADDLISRRYGEIVRLARAIDDTHLFGARTGYGGTGTKGVVRVMPFQLTSGAAHLDILSPEGYGYGPDNISDAAFVTAYARWAGNGKPVFWAEFGYSVLNGGTEALDTQADLYQAFADMVVRSDADGWAGWWYPGGLRVDERSDYGIVAPDGVPRPSTRFLKAFANRGTDIGTYATKNTKITIERDQFADGLAGVIGRFSKEFAELYEQNARPRILTEGTGTTSLTCPHTGVGGVPFSAPGPPQYLNAEIRVEPLSGSGSRVFVVNTGEAAWAPEDCVLVVESGLEAHVEHLANAVGRFEEWICELPGVVPGRAFMRSERFGPFGQQFVRGR